MQGLKNRLRDFRHSPWFNGKLLTGLAVLLAVALLGVLGPFFRDVKLARVASCPLNLPPAFVSAKARSLSAFLKPSAA